jgi:hypothetical protein
MLPDLRIVIAAVISTFIFTVGVGFFASSRLIHEQMTARVDTKGFDDTPVNRIALNWPEPTRTERNLDLDFAITFRGSRNPVRDVALDAEPQQAQRPAAPTAAEPALPAPPAEVAPRQEAAIRETEPKADATPTPAPTPAATPAPAAEATVQPESVERKPEPEPVIAVAKAPDPVEETPAPQPVLPMPATDTHIVVRPDDSVPVESTGSIPAPAPASNVPGIPVPEPRPKFAARTDAAHTVEPEKPVITGPARVPAAAKKRSRPARQQAAPRTPVPVQQTQPLPPFDFFGIFRAPQTTLRLPAQVSMPAPSTMP